MDIIRDIHVCFILGTFGVVEDPPIYCLISCHIFLCSFGLLSMLHSFCHQAGCMYVPFISFQTGRHLSVSFPISQLSSLSHVPHLSADGLGHQWQDCNCTRVRGHTPYHVWLKLSFQLYRIASFFPISSWSKPCIFISLACVRSHSEYPGSLGIIVVPMHHVTIDTTVCKICTIF